MNRNLRGTGECTTVRGALDGIMGRLGRVQGDTEGHFDLPLGPGQKGIPFTQGMAVGIPSFTSSSVTCEVVDGLIRVGDKVYATYLAPMPEGESLYCGYGCDSVNNYTSRLRDAGYFSVVGRAPVRSFGNHLAPSDVRVALSKCLDKYPRLRHWTKCSFVELFELVKRFGLDPQLLKTRGEKRLVQVLVEEVLGSRLGNKVHIQDNPQMYHSVYGLDQVFSSSLRVFCITMPQWMFDLNVRLVEGGFLPLVPSWIGYEDYQFNGNPSGPGCTGNFGLPVIMGVNNHPHLRLMRVVLPLVGASTTELSCDWFNGTDMRPSNEWEDRFRSVAENTLNGEPPQMKSSTDASTGYKSTRQRRYCSAVESLMLAASREIPIVLRKEGGDLRYIQADRITTRALNIQMDLSYWPGGEPCMPPMPKPKPKPKPKAGESTPTEPPSTGRVTTENEGYAVGW